jgi:hypothetical protein
MRTLLKHITLLRAAAIFPVKAILPVMTILPVLTIFSAGTLVSCKKFVQVSPPAGQSTTDQVFSGDATATAAMNGVYSQMMGDNYGLADAGVTLYAGLSADELYNTSPNPPVDQFAQNTLTANNPLLLNNFWGDAYNYLYQANAILAGLSASSALSIPVRVQLTGEASFVRAFCYLYLTGSFGAVPLETGTSYTVNAVQPRNPLPQVYQQMVTDLQTAQNLLTPSYPTQGPLRPNRWTAAALLARVYLYQGNWAGADSESSKVIDSGNYMLVKDPNNVFLAYSSEAIWQMTPAVPGLNTFEGNDFIPSDTSLVPAYALDSGLLNAFEPGDLRKADWLGLSTVSGQTFYYPYKYKIKTGNVNTENYMVLRLAEQYLIRSEARARMGDVHGAQSDLNLVRSRAGLAAATASTPETLLAAILRERRVELFAEWGHRWFDLRRTGTVDAVLGGEKQNWTGTDTLYPIPLSQLQANTFLTQNPGY